MKENKYRFIVFRKGADSSRLMAFDIIDMQENLSEIEINEKINWFIDNGYNQMADYKVVPMK